MDMGVMAVEKSWFAILNDQDIVEEIMQMPSAVEGPNYIKIPAEDQSLVGKRYNRVTGEFEVAEYYYAELDSKGIVVEIITLLTLQEKDNWIQIPAPDQSLIGKWYDEENKQFIDPPVHVTAAHSTDEICYKQEDKWLSKKLDEVDKIVNHFFRISGKGYDVGDIVRDVSLPSGVYLECAICGLTSEFDLPQMQRRIGEKVNDGTVTWVIRKQDHPQIGTILDWENAEEPGDGWLKCNGATYNSEDYPLLAIIRDPSNTGMFAVPDRRGYVPRGLDDGAGVDSEAARKVGSKQQDAIRNITGDVWTGQGNICNAVPMQGSGVFAINYSNGYWADAGNTDAYAASSVTFNASRIVPTATENRVKNVATKYYICYA